jgi:hypothetical protein
MFDHHLRDPLVSPKLILDKQNIKKMIY